MAQLQDKVGTVELPTAGTWKIDPAHSEIGFAARHLMLTKVKGRFGAFEGEIHVGADADRAWAEATIEAASVSTGVRMRDDHLRTAEFFDVTNHPNITARVGSLRAVEGHRYEATAELTIRGKTQEFPLDVEFLGTAEHFADGQPRAAFTGRGAVDLYTFGITPNPMAVGREVEIEITALAIPV